MQEQLKKYSEAYYAGNPLISDDQFDMLVERFGFNEVGAKPTEKVAKHLYRMYSLNKHYVGEGEEPLQEYEKIKSLKFDGAAISILYVDGVLAQVLTRGDGIEGQIITDKFIGSALVPQKISYKGLVQVTGEIVAPRSIENSRNYAAGALNLKDKEEFAKRTLTFIAYDCIHDWYLDYTYEENMSSLADAGFTVAHEVFMDQDIYPTDGYVYRINDTKEYISQGYTAKHPKGAYAVKTRGEAIETKLLAVEWQVGKSGKVTPVAILEPVLVGDALVSRATLNNQSYITDLGLYIGCGVGIIRAGEIIPQIVYKVED